MGYTGSHSEVYFETLFVFFVYYSFSTAFHTTLFKKKISLNLEKSRLASYICARFPNEEKHKQLILKY